MNVQLRNRNGTLTISLGGQPALNGGTGGSSGDSDVGGTRGTSVGGAGSCCGALILGPIIIPASSGDGDVGTGSSTGSGGGCCCPTVIGPIVFTGCCSNSTSTANTPPTPLTPVNIAEVMPATRGAKSPAGAATFEMQPQQEAQWCWAAVAVSVNDFLNAPRTWTQSKLAAKALNRTCSSVPNPEDPCDRAFSLDTALKATGNLLSPNGAQFDRFVNFADLQTYWAAVPYPVCARIVWDDGSGNAHFIALTGYTELANGQKLVTVHDPSPTAFAPTVWDYDLLKANYQGPSDPQDPGAVSPKGHWHDSYFVQP
jgi:Papain-like cysteine protease AvrRpt2